MSKPYQVLPPTTPVPAPDDVLETLVREGARKMLQDALEAGVDDFLRRRRYPRSEVYRGCLNGHLHERTIGVGMGAVEIRARLGPFGVRSGQWKAYHGSHASRRCPTSAAAVHASGTTSRRGVPGEAYWAVVGQI